MGLLRKQVDELAASGKPDYCRDVVQIGFNAWHYADSNLWASLGDEIFRQLAGPETSPAEHRKLITTKLAERLDQRRELQDATEQARATAADLQDQVDKAVAAQETTARDLIVALRQSGQLGDLWKKLGIRDEVEQAKVLAEQMRGTLTDADALRRSSGDRRGKIALAASATVLLAGTFVAVLAPAVRDWLAVVGPLFTVVAGTGITTAFTRARSGLRHLRALSDDLHAGMDSAAKSRVTEAVSGRVTALREATAKQLVAEAQLHEVVSHIGELGRQLTELAPGRRLYAFLADRAQGDSYTRNLGLISTIRKDFKELVTLLKDLQTKADRDASAGRPIDRIVLYIDDLDRCNPRQVVEVLQAVHLLLAFELFVVVVGVDPRWLMRSLSSHYDEILDESSAGGDPGDGWQVRPEDYLEKILNIPFILPEMSSGSMRRLLGSIVQDGPTPGTIEGSVGDRQPEQLPDPDYVDPNRMPIERGSEVDTQQRAGTARVVPRPLTDPELDLLATLDILVDTPRDAKRLFNLYRMLRATRDLSAASRFLGEDGQPGEYQAVIVLLGMLTAHARLLGRLFDARPDPVRQILGGLAHRSPRALWRQFVAEIEPRRGDRGWTNLIVGPLPEDEVRDWLHLHRGLAHVSAALTIYDVIVFQTWVPRIRRFSYVLHRAVEPPGQASSPVR